MEWQLALRLFQFLLYRGSSLGEPVQWALQTPGLSPACRALRTHLPLLSAAPLCLLLHPYQACPSSPTFPFP